MPHTTRAAVLHCIDFRLHEALRTFLHKEGYASSYDDISVAGAVKNLVDPYAATDPEFVLRQIAISRKLHGISDILLINHTDCGAYGHGTFASPDEERERHVRDLAQAKEIVHERFADDHLTVHTILGVLQSDGTWRFESVNV